MGNTQVDLSGASVKLGAQTTADSATARAQLGVGIIPANIHNSIQGGQYRAIPETGASQSAAMAADRAYAIPLVLDTNATLAAVALDCTAVATAGNVRAGLYATTSGDPDAKIADYGQVTIPTGGVALMSWTPSVDVLVAYTLYWLVFVSQGATGSPTYRQRNTSVGLVQYGSSAPANLSGSLNAVYTDTGFTGAFPANFGTRAGLTTGPAVLVKA